MTAHTMEHLGYRPSMEPDKKHIYDLNPREAHAVNRFLVQGQGLFNMWLQPLLNWPLPWMWMGLRIPHERLVGKAMAAEQGWKGDVDVFGGPVLWEDDPTVLDAHRRFEQIGGAQTQQLTACSLVEEGRIPWPPDLRAITAAEVKAARYDRDGNLKSTGLRRRAQSHARKQAEILCEMGFSRVLLLRFLAGQASEWDPSPWLESAGRGGEAGSRHGAEVFFAPDDPFGTATINVGGVGPGLEHLHGAGGIRVFRAPPPNPRSDEDVALMARRSILERVHGVLSSHGQPKHFPVLILACGPKGCGCLYSSPADPDLVCPSCGCAPY